MTIIILIQNADVQCRCRFKWCIKKMFISRVWKCKWLSTPIFFHSLSRNRFSLETSSEMYILQRYQRAMAINCLLKGLFVNIQKKSAWTNTNLHLWCLWWCWRCSRCRCWLACGVRYRACTATQRKRSVAVVKIENSFV